MGIEELLERVKAATGPDRRLDIAVHVIVANEGRMGDYASVEEYTSAAIQLGWNTPAYANSIDADIALVGRFLPGWRWNVGHDANDELYAVLWHGVVEYDEYGANPSLAIIAALLSALIAQRSSSNGN